MFLLQNEGKLTNYKYFKERKKPKHHKPVKILLHNFFYLRQRNIVAKSFIIVILAKNMISFKQKTNIKQKKNENIS